MRHFRFWLRWHFTPLGWRAQRVWWSWGEGEGPLPLTKGQAMTLARPRRR